MSPQAIDKLVRKIAAMDRNHLVKMLRNFHGNFRLDFTDQFLNSVSLERLQHICLAAHLHEALDSSGVA
ncbi:MAG: hypothetical protein SVT52_09150 [Planctomycetota bacterium]|nr:hypothetical protein [Planctomycetota bacterium]